MELCAARTAGVLHLLGKPAVVPSNADPARRLSSHGSARPDFGNPPPSLTPQLGVKLAIEALTWAFSWGE